MTISGKTRANRGYYDFRHFIFSFFTALSIMWYPSFCFSDVDSPIPAGGITITASLRKDSNDWSLIEQKELKKDNEEAEEKELDQSIISNKPMKLVKGHSADGQFSVKSSPLQSISSIDLSLQQYSGKNKEYFDNLQVCYDPGNISISPSPMASHAT